MLLVVDDEWDGHDVALLISFLQLVCQKYIADDILWVGIVTHLFIIKFQIINDGRAPTIIPKAIMNVPIAIHLFLFILSNLEKRTYP
jgi:hypothetical protein